MAKSASKPGDLNRNYQFLVAQTELPGTDHRQKIWTVQCRRPRAGGLCGHMYGVNASDFFQRKCPICQNGRPGLIIEEGVPTGPQGQKRVVATINTPELRMQGAPRTRSEGPLVSKRVPLPPPVVVIYRAVAELEKLYPRKFTPDGHLVGSIGEVVAAEALGLTLYPMSRTGHDGYDANGDVQIKMTAKNSIAMYTSCERLVVLRIASPEEAEIVYDGPGEPAWTCAGKVGKNGQRVVRLSKLRKLAENSN